MKQIFDLSYRTTLNESAEHSHDKFIRYLKKLGPPWGIKNDVIVPVPDFGRDFFADVTLKKFLENKIKGRIHYRYRNSLTDHHSCDDSILYEFNDKNIDYEHLILDRFTDFVANTNAYEASIFPDDLLLVTFEKSKFKNLRENIIHFYPVMYFDEILCEKALKMSPAKFVNAVEGIPERVEVFQDGVLLIASSKIMSVNACIVFDEEIRRSLLNV